MIDDSSHSRGLKGLKKDKKDKKDSLSSSDTVVMETSI
jgi:hypothetical protein